MYILDVLSCADMTRSGEIHVLVSRCPVPLITYCASLVYTGRVYIIASYTCKTLYCIAFYSNDT